MSATTPVLPSADAWGLYLNALDGDGTITLPAFWDDALALVCGNAAWSAEGQEKLLRRMMRDATIFATVRVFRALLTEGEHIVRGAVNKPEAGATRADRQRYKRSEEAATFTKGWADRLEYPLRHVAWDLAEAFPFGSKLCEAEYFTFTLDVPPFRGTSYVAPVDLSPKPRTVYNFVVDRAFRVQGVRSAGGISADVIPAPNLLWLSVGGMDRNPVGDPILASCWKPYHRRLEALDDESKTGKQSGFIVVKNDYPPAGTTDTGFIQVKLPNGAKEERSKLSIAADAMKKARRGMTAVMPPGMDAGMMQAGDFDFGSILDRCDREIVACFMGAARALKEAEHGSKADTGEATDVAETLRDWGRGLLCAAIQRFFAAVLRINFGDKYADVTPVYDIVTEEGADLAAIGLFLQGLFDQLTTDQKNYLAAKIGMPPFPKQEEQEQPDPTDAIDAEEQAKTEASVARFMRSFGTAFASSPKVANGAAKRRVDGTVRSAGKQFGNLVTRLAKGKLTEDEFVDRFGHTLSVAHERAYSLGYAHGGGGENLSQKGEEYVASIVASEGRYARDMAAKLAAGEISETEGLRRAQLYANRVRGSANAAFRQASEEAGLKLYWDLGAGDHCAECPRYASMSPWEPDELPTTPGEGGTPCGSNCTCGLRREDGLEGFAREASAVASGDGSGGEEEGDQVPENVTAAPALPKLYSGGRYVDLPPGLTLDDARATFQKAGVEVLSVVGDDGVHLAYAPIVGKKGSVDVSPFGGKLRDRIVTHNHPAGGMLSRDDLREAIDRDMARLEAVMPDGTILAWNRPAAGWPDSDAAQQAYLTGARRALKSGNAKGLRDRLRRQIDRTLGDAETFGDKALTIDVSAVESEGEAS